MTLDRTSRTRNSRHMSRAGVRWQRPSAAFTSGGRYRSTSTGSAHRRAANGSFTRTARVVGRSARHQGNCS